MVIDTHAHVWEAVDVAADVGVSGFPPNLKPRPTSPPEDLLREMDSCRVERAVLVQSSIYGWTNDYLVDTLLRHPDRFVGVVLVDPRSSSLSADMTRLSEHPQVKGVRFHALNPLHWEALASAWRRIAETATERQLVIAVQIEPGALSRLHELVQATPDVRLVIDHMGLVPVRERGNALGDLLGLSRHPNVFIKASGIEALTAAQYPFDDVRRLFDMVLEEFGARRVMWGSNFPQVANTCSYSEILGVATDWLSRYSPDERIAVLGGTAARVWGMEEGAAPRL